ncbi:MAG: murein hydrolase activator EnvC family protein [Actinomycetaceae bacterium]
MDTTSTVSSSTSWARFRIRARLLPLALLLLLAFTAGPPVPAAADGEPDGGAPGLGLFSDDVARAYATVRGGIVGDAGGSVGRSAGGSVGVDVGGSTGGDATVEYEWPTGGPVGVLSPFEGSATPYGPGHRGVDLDVRPGTAVLAAADGVVAFAGMVAGRPVLSIDHADGLRTTYEPVDAAVSRGDRVTAGQAVGSVTSVHCPPPGCLHWGARRGSHDYVDPLSLVGAGPRPVRLLPLGG